ncbi:MAG: alkaline phosphatase family protein, partial [Lentisphaeria bacterium]|nr:alkaline phosphatase family protein [Lentisphaeria bacterium]
KGASIQEVAADLEGMDRVAVLALDGLGRFAWNLWKGEMPYLVSLHARNSITLRSVMPSITPVNFATMVTGTDLAGHGIQAKQDDFACETLFDVVREGGGTSAGVGLDGYTGCALLGRCADILGNAGAVSDDAVADTVIEIADRAQPEFMIAQFGTVDDVFHQHGPSNPLVVPMLKGTDARMLRLVEHLKPLGYGIVILADHGQHDVTEFADEGILGIHGTDSPEDCLVPCTWL